MKKISTLEIEQEYSILKSGYERFNKSLHNQLDNILEDEDVILGFPIQSRIKNIDSVVDKIENGRFNIKKSIKELQDIVGLRIILLFKKDVEVVSRLINENLTVIKQYSSEEKLLDNQFGYSSQHFIVKIPESWSSVPTFKGLEDFNAEIQVRTLSQHTWAEASKELQYKQEESVPRQLLRSISRVSALLETVDLEFERLLKERLEYKIQISENTTGNNQKLNVDLLSSILDNLLPEINRKDKEPYSGLLQDLEKFDISNKEELEALIKKQLKNALKEDAEMVKKMGERNKRFEQNVFFAHSGLVRIMIGLENPDKWQKVKNYEIASK